MCGIAGIVDNAPEAKLTDAAARMAAALRHRGPDSNGVQVLGKCVLANTRLAIVDLSERGRQPMSNEDGSVWITYNGECYNAAELRPLLIDKGHRFRSATDTEVILHLYEEFGERCVQKLRGMFAFAIWDVRAQKLLLARDRLGIKPLYFAESHGRMLFGSELKALTASGLISPRLDAAGARVFLQLGHIPPPWSAIRGVRPLEPGHLGVWQDGNFRTSAYWTLPAASGSGKSPAEVADELGGLLLESSRLQRMSDVPIALFLSGGVDSAAICALMCRAGAGRLTALTIGFEENEFDETAASKRTADRLGIASREIRLPASRIGDSLHHALWAMDQPTVDGLNAYWISRAAAEAGFKVALTGQGGDELFGGYESLDWFERFERVASFLRPVPQSMGHLIDRKSFPFRWRKLSYLVGADDPFVASQLAVRVLFPNDDVRDLLAPCFAPQNGHCEAADHILELASLTEGRNVSDRISLLDFPAHLEARLLRDGDAMSMAHSLEVRPVFLDHSVVEYVMSLPAPLRLDNKRLLFAALQKQMPGDLYSDLAQRPKRTFTFPFSRWLSGALRGTIDNAFEPGRIAAQGVFRAPAVRNLWQRYLASPDSVGWSRLWSVFVLTRWCETMGVGA